MMITCRHDLFWMPANNFLCSLWNHRAKTNRKLVFTGSKTVPFYSHFKLTKWLFASSCTKCEWLNIYTTPERLQNNFCWHNQKQIKFLNMCQFKWQRDPWVKDSLHTNIKVVIHTDFSDYCSLKSLIYLWQVCVVQILLRKRETFIFF